MLLHTACRRLAVAARSQRVAMAGPQQQQTVKQHEDVLSVQLAAEAAAVAEPAPSHSHQEAKSSRPQRVTRASRRARQEEEETLEAVQARLQQAVRPAHAVEPVATKLAAVLVPLFAAPTSAAPGGGSGGGARTLQRRRVTEGSPSGEQPSTQTQQQRQQQQQLLQEEGEMPAGLQEVRVLLTRRSARLTSHQGEVCLPGGKRDPGDLDDTATALREANEELGLEHTHAQVLGCLQPLLSKHFLSVTPVVALIPPERALHAPLPNPDEVDEVFDVPLSIFLGTRGHTSRDISWQDVKYRIHSFEHDGHTVWGLTAAILIRVAKLAFGREPDFQEHAPNGSHYHRIWHDGQKLQVHTLATPPSSAEPHGLTSSNSAPPQDARL